MSLRSLLLLKAVVSLLLGVGILVAPGTVYGIFGATLAAAGAFAAREYAAAMLGNLCLCWIARDVAAGTARRAIVVALTVYDAVGLGASVAATLAGTLNFLGWGVAAIYLFFTIGFGAYAFRGSTSATVATAS